MSTEVRDDGKPGGVSGLALTVGSLFAGIGGFDLGLERAGMEVRWQVEIDPYCQRVLARHWPDCGQWDDVRTFPPDPAEDWTVDVICGGFPCQDISIAGNRHHKGAGLDGARSGLWFEYARIVRVLRPRFVIVENVPALFTLGFERVLSDLAEGGYDAEWALLSAANCGAPQTRKRLFILAYPKGTRLDGNKQKMGRQAGQGFSELLGWDTEPAVCRVANGVPRRMVRDPIRSLGNSIVPQVTEFIGRRIVECTTCRKP